MLRRWVVTRDRGGRVAPPRLLATAVAWIVLIVGTAASPVLADWPWGGALVASGTPSRQVPVAIPDGFGGQIVAWQETWRGGYKVFVSRMNATGTVLWSRSVDEQVGDQRQPALCSDGSGGAIVAWEDHRGAAPDIYVVRFSGVGDRVWGETALCAATGSQILPFIASDGAGGAIVAWWDRRTGADYDVYARRITAGGTLQWTINGVAVCNLLGDQMVGSIVADGSGGAILAWNDRRAGHSDIYAQRLSSAGAPQWTPSGRSLVTAAGDQVGPLVVPSVAGAIVAWTDYAGVDLNVYVGGLTSMGGPTFTVLACTATGNQIAHAIQPDGVGGAIVGWEDQRSGPAPDLYLQRVSSSGSLAWGPSGVALCVAASEQTALRFTGDGVGGVIACWSDRRGADSDLYAQRVAADGSPQWTGDGVLLCAATGDQFTPTIGSDGAGGTIVTWSDYRGGSTSELYSQRVNAGGAAGWAADGVLSTHAWGIDHHPFTSVPDDSGGTIVVWEEYWGGEHSFYAQRLDGAGNPLWPSQGRPFCTLRGDRRLGVVTRDGAGGVYAAWSESRSTHADVFAQRLDRFGSRMWAADGVVVCNAAGNQHQLAAVHDDAGGIIIAWRDERGAAANVHVQRLSVAGVPSWSPNGMAIAPSSLPQSYPAITGDGSRGAVLLWQDERNAPLGLSYDLYAGRVTDGGARPWGSGVGLCIRAAEQYDQHLVPDGAGGVIATWVDYRSGFREVYAGRIDGTGTPQWTPNGVLLSPPGHEAPNLVTDGSGGAIVTWSDHFTSNPRLFAQRIASTGVPQWTAGGVRVCPTTDTQLWATMISDGSGGAYVVWSDYSRGVQLHGQRLSKTGVRLWSDDGRLVASGPSGHQYPSLVSDGASGAHVVWLDYRAGNLRDALYATHFDPGGAVDVPGIDAPGAVMRMLPAAPNPTRDRTRITFVLPRRERASLKVVDLQGRIVRQLIDGELDAGEHAVDWDGRDQSGATTSAGVYFYCLRAGPESATGRLVRVR